MLGSPLRAVTPSLRILSQHSLQRYKGFWGVPQIARCLIGQVNAVNSMLKIQPPSSSCLGYWWSSANSDHLWCFSTWHHCWSSRVACFRSRFSMTHTGTQTVRDWCKLWLLVLNKNRTKGPLSIVSGCAQKHLTSAETNVLTCSPCNMMFS